MIKRYEIDGGLEGWREREYDDGDWVKFDDYEKSLAILESRVARLNNALTIYTMYGHLPLRYQKQVLAILEEERDANERL